MLDGNTHEGGHERCSAHCLGPFTHNLGYLFGGDGDQIRVFV